jgi:tetratricopeptide (TPR) repeat protein
MNQRPWYRRVGQVGRRLTVAERYYERGLDLYAKNKLDQAIADLDQAILADPQNGEFYVARGLMLLQQNRPDEAEEDFAFGLELDPTQWLVYYGRGMRAFKSGQYPEAVDQFSRAARIEPQRAEIYFYRAVAFYQMRNPEEAIRDMEFAQQLLSTDDARHKQAGQVLATFNKALPDQDKSDS